MHEKTTPHLHTDHWPLPASSIGQSQPLNKGSQRRLNRIHARLAQQHLHGIQDIEPDAKHLARSIPNPQDQHPARTIRKRSQLIRQSLLRRPQHTPALGDTHRL